MACQLCGQNVPTKYATLHYNIGLLVMRYTATIQGDFCQSCLTHRFWKYTLVTLVFGWWGFISFFMTPVILVSNLWQFFNARPTTDRPTPVPVSNVPMGKYCPHCQSSLSTVADFSRVPWVSLINSGLIFMLAGFLTLGFMINQTTSLQEWLIVMVLYGIVLFRVGSLVQSGRFSRKVCKQCEPSQPWVSTQA
ncbi:MAG: hypothetical protein U0401_05705 [Anaerolineae bacterium]